MNWVTFKSSSLNALLAGALRLAASQSPPAFEADVLQVHTQREKGWGDTGWSGAMCPAQRSSHRKKNKSLCQVLAKERGRGRVGCPGTLRS